MPMYVPRPPSDDQRRGAGDLPYEQAGGVRFESGLPSSYALAQQGIATESDVAIATYQQGAIFDTSPNTYVAIQDTVVTPDGVIEYTHIDVDVGAGSGGLLTVGGSVSQNEQTPASESSYTFDPLSEGESSNPVSYGVALTSEQSSPQGGDFVAVGEPVIYDGPALWTNFLIGQSAEEDIVSVVQGLSGAAEAIASLDTGDGREVVG
jgi:hypothetical protein